MQTEIIAIVIVLIIIYIFFIRKREGFLSPSGWAPVGADLFETVGRGPMFGYGTGVVYNSGITADMIETGGRRGAMFSS